MPYLCPHHLKSIAADPTLAMTLWNGAMDNGTDACLKRDWNAARSFFGAAYETAILHKRQKQASKVFSISHLIEASQKLSEVLQKLSLWEEAQTCLLTIQIGLLQESVKPNNDMVGPSTLLIKTQEVVDDMIELFNGSNLPRIQAISTEEQRSSKFAMGNAVSSISQKQFTDISNTITFDKDILLSSTFYLMTRYALKPTPQLSKLVAEHLERLFRNADCSTPALNNTCRQLCLQWKELRVSKNLNKPAADIGIVDSETPLH